jgi:hypothetical protein
MDTPPPLAELVPFLSERGVLEVDLALARWQIAQQAEQIAALQAEVDECPPS